MKNLLSFSKHFKNIALVLFAIFASSNMLAQNQISVPFLEGFVGDNTANNVSSNSLYLSALGWTNVQFTQNSATAEFVAQGNDIPGTVLITDNLGIQHSISGFIKWRAPSGNNITTPVFVPTTGVTLATNSSNGSNTYSITITSYIGLTFNGQSLTIPSTSSGGTTAGEVTGNAATSGILDALNAYLESFPSISITDVNVNEGVGNATVTVMLSSSSANAVTVAYATSNGTATSGLDYTAASGTLTFAANQTSTTFTIPIIDDTTIESTETINITLSDPTNASILNDAGVVTIADNDSCTITSISVSNFSVAENAGYAVFDVQGPNNSYVSLYLTDGSALGNGVDYGATATQSTLGQTNLEYSIDNGATWLIYQNYAQIPGCAKLKVRTPINDDVNIEPNQTFNLIVKPISVNLGVIDLYDVNYNTITLSSLVLESGTAEDINAVYKKTNAITVNSQAIDVKIKIIAKTNIGTGASDYLFDNDGTNSSRFQSEINSTSSSGSFVDYKIEFFKSGTNIPVALTNFYITGVDIDGNSATSKEYIELSNFSSYTVNNPSGLTIGVSPTNSLNTRFTGIDSSLSGITFENSASFIANYQSPLTELNFRKGVTGASNARQFSVAFGAAGGVFSTPVFTSTEDSEIAIATITDNDSCTAGTPTGSVTVQPTCATTTGTIVFTTQSGVEYSIDGTTYQSSATFTAVAAGSYTLKVRSTLDNTCTATGSTVTVNAASSAPSTPTGSVTVQPTCATTTGTIVFTTQSGVEYSIDGTTYQSSATFTAVAAGSYTLKVRSTLDNTCTATGSIVTVNAASSAPSTPTGSVTVQPTCATPTGTIVFTTQSGVEYSIDGTTYQSSATFTAVAAGSYTLKVRSTLDNTCTATGSTVTLYDPICAITDTAGPINGLVGATTASVLTNDTLNGVAVIPSAITLTGLTVPTGLTLNPNGTITIAPNTPADSYTVTYQICEVGDPINCSTTTATLVVGTCLSFPINDCDNDGESNGTEITNGTNPNNACSYTNAPSSSSSAYASWSVLDCDGDGTLNGSDLSPKDPCIYVSGATPDTTNPIWSAADCDNDGESNGAEITNGTNPNNACSYTNAPSSSSSAYATWSALDCDGDGTPNGSDLSPKDPCIFVSGATPDTTNPIWSAADCDNDGESNGTEITNGTNPNNACSYTNAPSSSSSAYASWSVLDCDGDGTPNGSDLSPKDPCIYVSGATPDTTNPIWSAADCDNDGESNGTEITNGTNPNNACSYTNAPSSSSLAYASWSVLDCDGDGTPNGSDLSPKDPCIYVSGATPDTTNPIWSAADCDNDGESNGTEITNGTNPNNACSYTNAPSSSSSAYASWSVFDCDGDGVTNAVELMDNTDPNNPCESKPEHITNTLSVSFLAGDCDDDGLTNQEEIGSNVNNPNDSNANGIPDYLEINNNIPSEDELEIFNAVTPNGNGDNDVFVIRNIQNYPNNSITIFNRWGVVVYETEGYGQNGKFFKGISEGRSTINKNEELPIGNYFYILRYVNDNGVSKERSGYLYLNK